MPADSNRSDSRSFRFRLPSVGTLVVFAIMLVVGGAVLTWWTLRTGIRQVEAAEGSVGVLLIPLAEFVTSLIEIDDSLLATDRHVINFELQGSHVDDQFLSIFRRFPNVEYLGLIKTTVTDRSLAEVTGMSQLNSIALHDSPGVTDMGIAQLVRVPNLQWLFLSNLPITGAGLSQLKQLDELYIERCHGLAPHAIHELSQLPNLTYLSFTGSNLTDESLQGFGDAPLLESLALNETDITDVSLSRLADQFPNLTVLSISGLSGITDAGVLQLISMKHLESLDIANSHISPATAAAVKKSLPNCHVYHEE